MAERLVLSAEQPMRISSLKGGANTTRTNAEQSTAGK
jgi:hypothetical protein